MSKPSSTTKPEVIISHRPQPHPQHHSQVLIQSQQQQEHLTYYQQHQHKHQQMHFPQQQQHPLTHQRWGKKPHPNLFRGTSGGNAYGGGSSGGRTGPGGGVNGPRHPHWSHGHRRPRGTGGRQRGSKSDEDEDEGDVARSEALKRELETRNVFDTSTGLHRRRVVLTRLETLLCQWAEELKLVGGVEPNEVGSSEEKTVKEKAILQDPSARNRRNGKSPRVALVSFGSYRLGVHKPGADIDCLALCPPQCTRVDFFGSLVKLLEEEGNGVEELHPVPGAYTPVIKFCMDGVAVDLVFARLANGRKLLDPPSAHHSPTRKAGDGSDLSTPDLPPITPPLPAEEFHLGDEDLIGLDEAGVRSLNGVRVAQMILRIVPNKMRFQMTLRTVKEWALVHGLYSNVIGFLGGVNWAILVAWVCKRNPEASVPRLLKQFFYVFSQWRWPKAVCLNYPIANTPPPGVMPLPVWNPKTSARDSLHIMPIITPAYPSMNSSYNVGQPQLRRISQELVRGGNVLTGIFHGSNKWEDLFVGNDFFRQHVHYLQVNISARSAKDFRAWFGLCESRLRILIAGLDSPENGVHSFPFAKFFHRKVYNDQASDTSSISAECKHLTSFFIALRFDYGVENVDLKSCTEEFLYKVNAWEGRRFGMDLTIEHTLQKQLPSFVFDDKELKDFNIVTDLKGQNPQEPSKTKSRTKPPVAPSRIEEPATSCDDSGSKEPSKDETFRPLPGRSGPSSNPSPMKRPRRKSPTPDANLESGKKKGDCLSSR